MKQFLAALAAIIATATPVLAQSFDPDTGTGNVLQFSHIAPAPAGRTAVQNGLSAYAMGFARVTEGSNTRAATGGGSTGYNEMLRNY